MSTAAKAAGVSPVQTAPAQAPLGMAWTLRAAISLVTIAGISLVVLAGVTAGPTEWLAVLAFAGLAMAAERTDLSLYGGSRVSLAFVPIFASVLLAGMVGLAVVVPAAMVGSHVGSGRPLFKSAYNFGVLMISGATSALVLSAFGPASHPDKWPWVLGPAVAAGGANFLVNSFLVAGAIALANHTRVRPVWAEHFLWLTPHYLGLAVLSLAMAEAYEAMGFWGIGVFVAPALLMRVSIKQYVDRTTKGVLELRSANDNLQAAHDEVTAAMDSLGKAYDGTLRSLVAALDLRDSETKGHSERVAELTMAISAEIGIQQDTDRWRHISWGALLHDVGKIAIPDQILRKPSALEEFEWEAMRTHPEAGHEILQSVEFLAPAAEVVLCHHERFDGTGYPRGLSGEEIPIGARIFSVADAFDAMTSHRSYRAAMPPEQALAEILRNSGTQFDPYAVMAFLSVYRSRFVDKQPAQSQGNQLTEVLKRAILEAAGLERGL